MASTTDIGTLITATPGICGGLPRIAGTGVSVRRIVRWYQLGYTPDEIHSEIPHLTLAQVHAALAYYHANRDAMDQSLAEKRKKNVLSVNFFGRRKRIECQALFRRRRNGPVAGGCIASTRG